jgi:hypothetical protein
VKAERIAKLSYNMFVGHTHSSWSPRIRECCYYTERLQ